MVCEHCKERHANVTVTQVQNGQKIERHYCDVCASQFHPFQFDVQEEPISLQQFITNWFGTPVKSKTSSELKSTQTQLSCPSCQLTYAQFLKSGKFGCGMCYSTFRNQLPQILEKLQAGTKHINEQHDQKLNMEQFERQIKLYRQQMKQAIEEERFEDAAKFRDEIKHLETKLQAGGVDTP